MVCRCLSDAKLLNNLWGTFPLEQKHTLQLTGDQPFQGRLQSFTCAYNSLCFPSRSKSCCCIPAAKGLPYLAIEVTHLVQGDVLCTTIEFDHLFIRHRFEPSRPKTRQFVNNHQSVQCYKQWRKTGQANRLFPKTQKFLLLKRDRQRDQQL